MTLRQHHTDLQEEDSKQHLASMGVLQLHAQHRCTCVMYCDTLTVDGIAALILDCLPVILLLDPRTLMTVFSVQWSWKRLGKVENSALSSRLLDVYHSQLA